MPRRRKTEPVDVADTPMPGDRPFPGLELERLNVHRVLELLDTGRTVQWVADALGLPRAAVQRIAHRERVYRRESDTVLRPASTQAGRLVDLQAAAIRSGDPLAISLARTASTALDGLEQRIAELGGRR